MSTFGQLFQVSTFGESHCHGVGCIVQGVPPRMRLDPADVQKQLDRRRPGQSKITTQRQEKDQAIIMSGVEHGLTLGTPISILVRNEDQRPHDYGSMSDIPRPSHADYTYQAKYGVRASSGGGRASARETIGRVAAGAIAEKWLREKYGIEIVAWVSSVGDVSASREWEEKEVTRDQVDANIVRCPDATAAASMQQLIESALEAKDSLGGIVTCVVHNVPAGLGEPCFDKLEALLAHAMMSIPSTKAFEVGSGMEGTKMKGSQHNDRFIVKSQKEATSEDASTSSSSSVPSPSPPPANPASTSTPVTLSNRHARHLHTLTNRSGGIQGGISNGECLVMRIGFKPPATIGQEQPTVDFEGTETILRAKGRHDPCVLPRAIPIVEAMTALVLADCVLMQLAREGAAAQYPVLGKVQPPVNPDAAEAATAASSAQ